MIAFASAPLAVAIMAIAPAPERPCIALSLEVDGKRVEGVRIELVVERGTPMRVESCPGGFRVPAEASTCDTVMVSVIAPGRRLNLGSISCTKLHGVVAWRVGVDTPPFAPGYWSLRPPLGVKEIIGVSFEPSQGDGTGMAVYSYDKGMTNRMGDSLGEVLARVDLLENRQSLWLPRGEEWTLQTAATLAPAGAGDDTARKRDRVNGLVRVMSVERLKEIAEETLTEQPDADVALLLKAIVRQYCEEARVRNGPCASATDGFEPGACDVQPQPGIPVK